MEKGTKSHSTVQIDLLEEEEIRKAFLSEIYQPLRDVFSSDSEVAARIRDELKSLLGDHTDQAVINQQDANDQNWNSMHDQPLLLAQPVFIASLFITSMTSAEEAIESKTSKNPEDFQVQATERKKNLPNMLKEFLDKYVQLNKQEFRDQAEKEAKQLSKALGVKLVHTLGKIYTSPEPGKETAKKPEEEAAKKPGKETAKKPGEETAENPGKETAMKLGEETAKKESNLVDFGKTLLHECLRVLSEEDVNKVHNYHEHLKRLGEIYLQTHGESSERANDEGSSSVSEKKAVSIGDAMLHFLKWLGQFAKESAKKGFDPNEG